MKNLYHYTSAWHLPQILQSRYLELTQGILEDEVVWLTTTSTPKQIWQEGSIDKSDIRLVLKDIEAISWKYYRKKIIRGFNKQQKKKWADLLEKGNNPDLWWLSSERIPLERIESIENTKTGEKVNLNLNSVLKVRNQLSEHEIENILMLLKL